MLRTSVLNPVLDDAGSEGAGVLSEIGAGFETASFRREGFFLEAIIPRRGGLSLLVVVSGGKALLFLP